MCPLFVIVNGKVEQAKKDLHNRAKTNGKAPIPDNLLQMVEIEVTHNSQPTIRDLFRPKIIFQRSLNMFFQWFSVTMAYYGLLFASTSLSGDPYLNFALVVFVELGNVFLYYKLPDLIGRKMVVTGAQFGCGSCCLLAGFLLQFPQLQSLQVVLVMIGRLTSALGFTTVYLYTAELFPTQIRSTAVGCCSTIARVGGIIALIMQGFDRIWPPLTLVVFGSTAICAGFLATRFPETRFDKMPDSMEDALHLGEIPIKRNKFGFIIADEE